MRSESKEIYGANVFGLMAMFHQLRRWLVIRELRGCWSDSRRGLVACRKFNHLNSVSEHFNVQQRYKRIRMFVKPHQQRGVI
ncbi:MULTISPECIES: hypothetical protein [unclassified Providencia]|uniref:hypothetical protein n=1 Tax=unclassified Providencia TaxID=2633465 RepID=UPI00234A231A|nr:MULTISPECIES: hypothetical protein [unclassified Providencia]WOC01193.1 hypothetical protein P3L55_07750 [Providencia sp. PROV046]